MNGWIEEPKDLPDPEMNEVAPPEAFRPIEERRSAPLDSLRCLPALLSAKAAFEVMGVSRSKGYELLAAGVIPSIDLAGSKRIRTAELVEVVFGISPQELLGGDGIA